jgi:bifunctional non-homologous end joining protein LigD
VLDGEVIAVDAKGRPDFGLLQHRMHIANAAEARRRAADAPVSIMLFDLLCLDGNEAYPLPWTDRRRLLEELVDPGPRWQVSPVHDDGVVLLDAATAQGLEGVMAKRADSPYLPGRRSPAWRKVKVRRRQEFVVGGWWPGEGNRSGRLGSLLVGVRDPGDEGGPLRYSGKVGTGFTAATLTEYEALLAPLEIPDPPFDPPPPRTVTRAAHWVRPEVVVEVEFAEWTSEGILRHPSHLGRRVDKNPADVVREESPG